MIASALFLCNYLFLYLFSICVCICTCMCKCGCTCTFFYFHYFYSKAIYMHTKPQYQPPSLSLSSIICFIHFRYFPLCANSRGAAFICIQGEEIYDRARFQFSYSQPFKIHKKNMKIIKKKSDWLASYSYNAAVAIYHGTIICPFGTYSGKV